VSVAGRSLERLEGRRHLLPGLRASRRVWLLGFAGTLAIALAAALSRPLFNPAGWGHVGAFLAAALRPELSPSFLRLTWRAALDTLGYAVLGTTVSVLAGLVVGPLVSRVARQVGRRGQGLGMGAARALLSGPRGLHEVVWGLLLVNLLGADPAVAVLAIGLPYGAITAKVFAEILDETPQHAFDALRAAGARRAAAIGYGLLPYALPDLVSYSFYRFECSVRSAAVLGVIGAGGLGYELLLSFRTLAYGEMWTLIYALMGLSGLADLWSGVIRRRLASGRTRRVVRASAAIWLMLVIVSASYVGLDLRLLTPQELAARLVAMLGSAWPPALPGGSWAVVARASLSTLQMSLIAIALAASAGALAAALGFTATGRCGRLLRWGVKLLLLVCRAVPPPVWALVVLFVLLPGVLPGAVALALYNFGILGRLMGEASEDAGRAPTQALVAAGAGPVSAWLYGTAPRLVPRFSALALYRWEVTTRETVIVGLVGAGGLGRLLSDAFAAFDLHAVFGVLLALIAIAVVVDAVSAQARAALR
jgi:phosphonate transport system permease protein